MQIPGTQQGDSDAIEKRPDHWAADAVHLLAPLIGIRGHYDGHVLELVEVLADGPQVALLDISSTPRIQTNQYGDPLTRQPRILTLPVMSAIAADVHPVLRAILPEKILEDLRQLTESSVCRSS